MVLGRWAWWWDMAVMVHGLQGARKSHSENCHLHHVTVLVYYVPMTRNEAVFEKESMPSGQNKKALWLPSPS